MVLKTSLPEKWKGWVWLRPKDGYIRIKFMVNFWRRLKWCSRKFDKEFIFIWPSFWQSQTPPLHFTGSEVFDTTWALLKYYKMSNLKSGAKLPTKTRGFERLNNVNIHLRDHLWISWNLFRMELLSLDWIATILALNVSKRLKMGVNLKWLDLAKR